MPEPRINDLDAQNEGIRDGITIPSHLTEALASRGKTCPNCPIVFFQREPPENTSVRAPASTR